MADILSRGALTQIHLNVSTGDDWATAYLADPSFASVHQDTNQFHRQGF